MKKIDLKSIDKTNWKIFRFDQIAEKISETVDPGETNLNIYIGLDHLDPESIHIKRRGIPADVSGGKLKCYPGDIIFGKRRAYQRKAAIVDFEGICSAHAFVLRAIPEVMDPKLFPFFLHSDLFMHCTVDISVGGLSPTINWGQLKEQEFLLPPKDQQAKLAELLWAMDDVIVRETDVIKYLELNKLSFVKKEIFHNAIENHIQFASLGELFEVKTGSKNAQDAVENGAYPFFTRSLETQRIDKFDYDQEALILPGEGNFYIKYYKGKFNVHQRTYVLTTNKGRKINLPLYRDIVQEKVGELVQKSVGSTVNSLRKPIIESIKVPLLSEMMQDFYFLKMSKLDNVILLSEQKISHAKDLQKSFINKIF